MRAVKSVEEKPDGHFVFDECADPAPAGRLRGAALTRGARPARSDHSAFERVFDIADQIYKDNVRCQRRFPSASGAPLRQQRPLLPPRASRACQGAP